MIEREVASLRIEITRLAAARDMGMEAMRQVRLILWERARVDVLIIRGVARRIEGDCCGHSARENDQHGKKFASRFRCGLGFLNLPVFFLWLIRNNLNIQ